VHLKSLRSSLAATRRRIRRITVKANTLALNCLVAGDDPDRIFTIEIAKTKNVGALKDAIKDKKKPAFDHVPADTLVIQKVSLPGDESLKGNLINFSGERLSLPLVKLSQVFSNVNDTDLHIVVGRPLGACNGIPLS
jgi:hypothetical protein